MHSKWQIWDFFSSFDKNFLAEYEGLLALHTFDPVCLMMVKNHLTRGLGDRPLFHKVATDVSRNWLEAEFQTLSLFAETNSYYIHQSQDLSQDLLEKIATLDITQRFMVLSFDKDNVQWKKVLKDGKIPTLIIEPPRFWELNKLLDFVCSYLHLPISFEAKGWMLSALENDLGTFYNSCSLLKLNFPDSKDISLSDVRELLTVERLDQFALASAFARKKKVDFYERLVVLEGDFDKMRSFFNFIQSHLIKMIDTSYLNQKPRLTQYDKDLQSTSKLWKKAEVMVELEKFNRWEIMSKRKDHLLWHELKNAYLQSLSRS